VGFRRTALSSVTNYSVTGYVANTNSGTVHMVVEGTRSDVSAAIHAVRTQMSGFLTGQTEVWSAATGEFPDFRVRGNEP